jgi:hypothetical protein
MYGIPDGRRRVRRSTKLRNLRGFSMHQKSTNPLLKALASAVKYQMREMRQAQQVHPKRS